MRADEAQAALRDSAAIRVRLADRSGWAQRYFLLWALALMVLTLVYGFFVSGLLAGYASLLVVTFLVLTASIDRWADGRRVVGHRFQRTRIIARLVSFLIVTPLTLYAVFQHPEGWAFWLPAALASSAPLLLAALIVRARASQP